MIVSFSAGCLSIGGLEGQDLEVAVGGIDPVMDAVAGEDADFHAAADAGAFVLVGMTFGKLP